MFLHIKNMKLTGLRSSVHEWSNLCSQPRAGLAQLVERVICNHEVAGSIPAAGTIFYNYFICLTENSLRWVFLFWVMGRICGAPTPSRHKQPKLFGDSLRRILSRKTPTARLALLAPSRHKEKCEIYIKIQRRAQLLRWNNLQAIVTCSRQTV